MAEKKRGPGRPPGSKNKKKTEDPAAKAKAEQHQAKAKAITDKERTGKKVRDDIWGVVLLALGVFLIATTQFDTTGAFGEALHNVLKGLFGFMAYVLPYYFIVIAICLFLKKMQHINLRTTVFAALVFVMICILNAYRYINPRNPGMGISDIRDYYAGGISGDGAGVIGMEFGSILAKLFGMPGLVIISLAVIAISALLVFNTPISTTLAGFNDKRKQKKIIKRMQLEDEQAELEEAARKAGFKKIEQNPLPEIDFTDGRKIKGAAPANEPEPEFIIPVNKPSIIEDPFEELTAFDSETNESKAKVLSSSDIFGIEPGKSGNFGLNGNTEKPQKGMGLGAGYEYSESLSHHEEQPKQDNKKREAGKTASIAANKPEPVSDAKTEEPAEGIKINTYKKPGKETIALAQAEVDREIKESANTVDSSYKLPSTNLLKRPKTGRAGMSEHQLQQRANLLENTLKNFNVDAKVVQVTQGASVTRYEVQPATGVKVSKITALSDDIALNMRAKSIRMEAPIPGKAAVGIEVENESAQPVLIRELIESEEFRNSESKLSFVVGKDISGNNVVADLRKMPHLLIAGATGSGKSVCINSILASFLYKARPDELKLVLVDPKVVELGNYNEIPHLLVPVVTDPKKAAGALGWAVNEMNQRYLAFAAIGTKDIDSYNDYMRANQEPEHTLPEVVVVIDELADLMMSSPSQVEDAICRIAQKGRASGIHLIVATQRPSVDVVTGLIKANIPSRIAFSVASQFDSRTILDSGGAEKLLGRGDMLFSPVTENKPLRIQGPFISESETNALLDFIRRQEEADYSEDVQNALDSADPAKAAETSDDLTDDAIAFILSQRKASTSMLQRRFRIGYNRAASIIDEIERRGIIGPSEGSKPREVLFTEEEYYRRFEDDPAGEQEGVNGEGDE
jgi:S-DNA-T family DNA segregation ATPase FtsK/SpoIIIE